MSEPQFPKPQFRQETRLGLVVYGGVSLAIYMNGVCREFYNAVRGRGIYKLVKALSDADIVVDIISGTSAGGINGVLLSYALSNSNGEEIVDFASFADIWRDNGNIRQLLHEPLTQLQKSDRNSLLDGDGYYQASLQKAFHQAYVSKTSAPVDEWSSISNELDLFVTGTDVLGKIYTILDDTCKVIEVSDHQAIFHLKHRQGRKEPFNPEFNLPGQDYLPQTTYQALAKLCRITSCFPVAFPVVTVQLENPEEPADDKLVRWGDLQNRKLPETPPSQGYRLHFVDGGVLDNRPFSYTVKEIAYRVANRPVERKLFYIDPKPDILLGSEKFKRMPKPDIWEIVQDSLVGMPTYESISHDLELISRHNDQVIRYNDLFAQLEVPVIQSAVNSSLEEIDLQEAVYLRSRLIRLRDRVIPLVLRLEQNERDISPQSKREILTKAANILAYSLDKQTEILSRTSQQIRNLDVDYALRKHQYIVRKIADFMDREGTQSEYQKLQKLVACLNRQIKLLEVINHGVQSFFSSQAVSQYFYELLEDNSVTNRLSSTNTNVTASFYDSLIKLHRFWLDADSITGLFTPITSLQDTLETTEYFFTKLPLEAQNLSVPDQNVQAFTEQDHEWLPQNLLTDLLNKFKQKIAQVNDNTIDLLKIFDEQKFQNNEDENDNHELSTCLRKTEEASERLIQTSESKYSEEILSQFQTFRKLDEIFYSLEYITDLGAKNLIQTIRISPEDAALGFGANFEPGKRLAGKLAGDSLRAFGGFFKKSWRSNDILWGRLDGLNRLVEALVTPQAVENFPRFLQRQAKENGVSSSGEEFANFQAEYIDFLTQEAFPHAEASSQLKIKEHLLQLANSETPLSSSQLQPIINNLVTEGQREILHSDLSKVIEDEIEEQLEWNQQRIQPENTVSNKISNSPPKYDSVRGSFGSMINSLATAELARQSLKSLGTNQETFFRTKYKVGSEKILTDIPPIVLLNLSIRSGLVLRDLLNTSLGQERAAQLHRRLIYQVLNKTLQLFYWLLQLQGPEILRSINFSNSPPLVLAFQLILLILAIVGIVIIFSKSIPWVIFTVVAIALVVILEKIQTRGSK